MINIVERIQDAFFLALESLSFFIPPIIKGQSIVRRENSEPRIIALVAPPTYSNYPVIESMNVVEQCGSALERLRVK